MVREEEEIRETREQAEDNPTHENEILARVLGWVLGERDSILEGE